MKKIFWLAGEKSGDKHAAIVLEEFSKRNPEVEHFGIGGPLMQNFGLRPLYNFSKFSVMGFVEIVKELSFFLKVKREIVESLKKENPDLVILVDYPGMNFRIAKEAKRLGIPVLYYISPKFWAWKFKRIFKLKDFTDHVASILPFEQEIFDKYNVKSTYVGNPLIEEIKVKISRDKFAEKYHLDAAKKWLGFFPGSRNIEIKRMMPEIRQTIDILKNNFDCEFLISKADSVKTPLFNNFIENSDTIIEEDYHEMMKHCYFNIVTSGTATLECAILETPFLLVYKANSISYQIAKRLVKVDFIGLPNIIANKEIVPELIQKEAEAKNLSKKIKFYLHKKSKYKEMQQKLIEMEEILGSKTTSNAVCDLIEKFL